MSGLEAVAHALAGSTGGIVAMTLLYPLENIRTRLQVQVTRTKGVPHLSNAPEVAKPTHTCMEHGGAGAQMNVHEPEECISPETPHQRRTHTSAAAVTPTTKEEYFALHSAKLAPLAPPCIACILESSSSASSSTSAQLVAPVAATSASGVSEYEFRGSFDVVRQVCMKEGWRKLYSGLESALIGVGASSAVYFFFYYTFKSLVLAQTGKTTMGPLANLGVASVAGIVNVIMTLPIWLVNTRMAVAQRGEYSSVWDALRKIHAEEGIKGFYRGLVPSLILVSNPAIQFVVYEQMIALYTRAAQKSLIAVAGSVASPATAASAGPVRLSSVQYFLLGAFAKAVATVVTYPYQVIKSRLQASRSTSHSTWGLILSMWRQEGLGAFYSGMNAKMSQTVLNSAFMFAVYERLVRSMLKFLQWLRTSYSTLPKPQ